MKKTFKIWLIAIGLIMLITPVIFYSAKFYYQSKTKKLYYKAEKEFYEKYAYITYSGNLDQVLYGQDLIEGSKLNNYYHQLKKFYSQRKTEKNHQDSEPTIPISLNYISVTKPIYFPPFKETDSIIKGYVFNLNCWGYYEVYLPKLIVKDSLPSSQLLNKFHKQISKLPKNRSKNFQTKSPYGFYCN